MRAKCDPNLLRKIQDDDDDDSVSGADRRLCSSEVKAQKSTRAQMGRRVRVQATTWESKGARCDQKCLGQLKWSITVEPSSKCEENHSDQSDL